MKEYYTVKEAAEILNVSTRTILRWVEAEKLEVFRVNSTIRIPRYAIPTYERENGGQE